MVRCYKIVDVGNEILKEFGKAILTEMKQIFSEGSNVVIPFTEDSLRDICGMYGLDFEDVAKAFNVGFVNYGVNDNYTSLACCAFQVMVAYDCLAKDSRSYNDKLVKFIQRSRKYFGEPELQQTYSEEFHGYGRAKKQELLWEGAQKLLKANGLNLRIPERSSYSGRYVQYPLKQRIIDRKTLQKYIEAFKKRYNNKIDKSYSFSAFSDDLFKNTTIVHENENSSLLDSKEADRIAKRIIFYCFCNWIEHEAQIKTKKKRDEFKIRISGGVFSLYKNGDKIEISSLSVPKRPFIYDETYDEWILSYSDITPSEDETIGVLLDFQDCQNNTSLLNDSDFYVWEYSRLKKFYINPTKYIRTQEDWLKKENIRFVGGVKDNGGRWISTLLPTIINIKRQNSIVIDHKSYSLDEGRLDLNTVQGLGEGIHVIRLFDCSPILFKVVEQNKKHNIQRGWTWKKRQARFLETIGKDVILSGLFTGVPDVYDIENNYWGNAKLERINDKYDRIRALSKLRGNR